MEKRVTIEDFKKEAKKREVKNWVQDKAFRAANWVGNNKEMVMVLGPAALGAATTGVKVVSRRVQQSKAKDLKELYCYDPSLGHYWKLRRKLSNAEWVAIDKRKQNGERLADILSELKVLK